MIHPSADVSPQAQIGEGTRIWHQAQVREGVKIGENCTIGKNVYIDFGVEIGENVKIQNNGLIYHGAKLETGVFIGPQACLANDRYPRAITPEGQLKGTDDWDVGPVLIRYGASIGAGALVLPDVIVGHFAMVAAGAVVTADVPDHGLVVGIPSRMVGYACSCGRALAKDKDIWRCPSCDWVLQL